MTTTYCRYITSFPSGRCRPGESRDPVPDHLILQVYYHLPLNRRPAPFTRSYPDVFLQRGNKDLPIAHLSPRTVGSC